MGKSLVSCIPHDRFLLHLLFGDYGDSAITCIQIMFFIIISSPARMMGGSGVMFLTCSSVCACVYACPSVASSTGLPSTPIRFVFVM